MHLLLFTAGAYVAHRRLALRRPGPEHLTGFYLVVALGGVLGGAWNAFVAPLVFDRVIEYPLAILAVAVLGLTPLRTATPLLRRRYGRLGIGVEVGLGFGATFGLAVLLEGEGSSVAIAGLVVLGAAAVAGSRMAPTLAVGAAALLVVQILAPLPNDPALESRTFFGVYRVDRFDDHVELISGSTSHGAQDPSRPGEPLSYYTRGGPIGQLMDVFAVGADEVGLVGLGVGALAAYGDVGQRFTFFEIDPEVVRIARDSGWFTYLTDTPAAVDYRIGDGRLELAAEDRAYDVLVLDAFSGDAIPVHLLTAEAFELYGDRLADGGVIAVHISNRYLDLRPVIAGSAEANGMAVRVRRDGTGAGAGTSGSWWMVLAQEVDTLAVLDGDDRWHPGDEAGVVEWTDQRSNLLDVLGVDD
jgi:SAM-dependent methyltransferase